ncbi:MAG: hypothetical protein ABWK05_07075 [Pyrobaculum sp.]
MLSTLYKSTVLTSAVIMALIPFALGRIDPLGMAVIVLGSLAVFELYGAEYGYHVSPILALLFVLMYYGLIGMTQFVIVAGAVVALVAIKDADKLKFVGNNATVTLLYPLRMMGMAVLAVFSIFYLIYTAIRYGRLIYKVAALLAVILGIGHILYSYIDLSMGVFTSKIDMTNPVTWLGLVGYEELISRPLGVVGNAFWVLLHFPSRYYALGPAALLAILLIANGGRWLYETYKKSGIVGSIIGHVVYNAYLTLMAYSGILMLPVLLLIGVIAYFIFNQVGRGYE